MRAKSFWWPRNPTTDIVGGDGVKEDCARGVTKRTSLTLELYASAAGVGMDSNEECHPAGKEEVDGGDLWSD